jgi:hypothetical protein
VRRVARDAGDQRGAKAFDLALDRQCAEIVRALQRSDRERMETELSVFTAALARDLIDAGDFAL